MVRMVIKALCLAYVIAMQCLPPRIALAAKATEVEGADATAKRIAAAVKLAKLGKQKAFVDLLEISDNAPKIAVEQSESAYEELMILLKDDHKRWLEALSGKELAKTKKVIGQLGIPDAPAGIDPKTGFRPALFSKLRMTKVTTASAIALKDFLLTQEGK